VGLTEGLVNPKMLTWKGRSKKAPDTPPMEVKKDTANATSKRIAGETSIPDAGKYITPSSERIRLEIPGW